MAEAADSEKMQRGSRARKEEENDPAPAFS